MDRSFYVTKLEEAKSQADNAIVQGMAAIFDGLSTSINVLKTANQPPQINVDQIVSDLNTARDEWIAHVRGTFDTQILALKQTLTRLLS
jgi:hypothetical protein